jgi:peptidoglycan/LPS O-acetylase OafA/YrhL
MGNNERLSCVDGLRGIAVLLIVLFHFRLLVEGIGSLTHFRMLLAPGRWGATGIQFFLVLSGFGLSYSLMQKARYGQVTGFLPYLLRRWKRIAPSYYVAIFIYVAVTAIHRDGVAIQGGIFRQIVVHLLFLHGFWADTIYAISAPLWFLSMLFQIYLILPVLFALAEKFGYLLVIPLSIASSLAWRLLLVRVSQILGRISSQPAGGFRLGRGIVSFAFGGLSAATVRLCGSADKLG